MFCDNGGSTDHLLHPRIVICSRVRASAAQVKPAAARCASDGMPARAPRPTPVGEGPARGGGGQEADAADQLSGTADALLRGSFDLILAGHTHGGQVHIPLLDRPVLADMAGPYDRGLFRAAAGPLHVNPGIGTFLVPVRLACRPEITVVAF